MRPVAVLGILVTLAFAGCVADLEGRLSFSVEEAELVEGHCTWGVRDGGHGPEWCHVLVVEAHNGDPNQGRDVAATAWEAIGDDRASYGFPRVAGESTLAAGETRSFDLRFDAPEDVRFNLLRYVGAEGGSTAAAVPEY